MTGFKNKTVLVTGGAGFIGSHLVKRLVSDGARVRVVDNLSRGKIKNLESVIKQIEFIKEDLTQESTCLRACKDQEIVFHLASKVGGIGYYLSKPSEVYLNNLLMDTLVFKSASKLGVKKYLFSSSAHVYPRHLQTSPNSPPLKETDAYPADPSISYGWAKLLSEKTIQYQNEEGSDMRTSIVRIVGAYGENQDMDIATGSVIPVFSRRAIEFPKHGPFAMYGTGNETRSYCHISDILNGLILSVERLDDFKEIGPINLGSEGRVTILEIAKMIIEFSGKKIEIQHLPAKESGIQGQAVDMSLTKKVLDGWSPQLSLREGILRAYKNVEERLITPE